MRKVLAGILFALVGIFFGVSYFMITTSGEDIYQGAGTEPAVLQDMGEAFQHNARIPDMYAWSVINFFDYQYSFGVDTIFRLVDVALGMGMLYLMVYVVLGRKLKLQLGDAALFALAFLLIFLTPHGRVLYAGFSAIHNYLLIAVITLAFGLWYLKRVRGMEIRENWWLRGGMLALGVVFGLSSNLTPIAFLLTMAVLLVIQMMREKSLKAGLLTMKDWQWLGVVGVLVGIGIAYIFGPGVSGYLDSSYVTEYDYVSLGEIWAEPVGSMVRIVKHLVNNFARVFGPVILVLAVMALGKWLMERRKKQAWLPEDVGVGRLLGALVLFAAIHVIIAAQLNAPIRILLPAYLAMIMVALVMAKEWFAQKDLRLVTVGLILMVSAVVIVRMVLALDYHKKAAMVLEKIRESESEVVCVTREEVRSRVLPVVYLGQEEMLADWAMPERVYGKEVKWCE